MTPAYCFYKDFEIEEEKSFSFDRHYLLYATKGVIEFTDEKGKWLLPPERAAWIPAETTMRIAIKQMTTACSLLFDIEFLNKSIDEFKVFNVSPMAQQMILHCKQWGPDSDTWSDEAEHFFHAIGNLCLELAQEQPVFWLPKGQSQSVIDVVEWSLTNIANDVSIDDAANKVHMSSRTLLRHLDQEIGLNWRELRQQQRMLSAMDWVLSTERSITEIYLDVGYQSQSSFNQAFKQHFGQSPTQVRALFQK